MDWTTLGASLALNTVAAGAIGSLFRWLINRDLTARRIELEEASKKSIENHTAALKQQLTEHESGVTQRREELLANYKAQIDEAVQLRLLERKSEVDRQIHSEVEQARAQIERDLKAYEKQLRVESEIEVRRYEKEFELYTAARRAVSELNDAIVASLRDLQHASLPARVGKARAVITETGAAAALLPSPYRLEVLRHIEFVESATMELEWVVESAAKGKTWLMDEQRRLAEFMESAVKCKEAFEAFYKDLNTRHRAATDEKS